MTEVHADQQFVEMIIKAIVAHPDDVRTERIVDERGVLISLHVHPEDMGYVIGREGQTARAVRTLVKTIGAKNNARVNLKIVEPEGSRGPRRREFSEQDQRGGATGGGAFNRGPSHRDDLPSIDDLGI